MKFFLFVTTLMIFSACGHPHLFDLTLEREGIFTLNSKANISLKNHKEKQIDSVVYYFQEQKFSSKKNIQLSIQNVKLGKHKIRAYVYYENKVDSISKNLKIFSDTSPKIYTYKIVNEYSHDINAYTQGLEFYKGVLYESTGLYGKSSIRQVDYKTGKILKKMNLNDAYFGEGITIMNDKIYQLTWLKKIGFIYNLNFQKEGVFSFNRSKEGWGICNDGKHLYKSDGSDKIWRLDPNTLFEVDNIQICTDKSIYSKANELEWVDGKIYANTYLKDGIMIINPNNGAVLGVVDCRGLKKKVTQHKDLNVLNGIAYNLETKTFFVTGKNWDKLFEIEIVEKL